MKHLLSAVCFGIAICAAAHLQADERPDHYKGKPSNTLEQAVANFSEYNQRLKVLLASELTPMAMVEIHELTYTLEVALEKIHSETAKLKDALEEVHVSSEHMDMENAKRSGDAYIKTAQTLMK